MLRNMDKMGQFVVLHREGVMLKLVVFVPDSHKESVKKALFKAGAGSQGAYSECAWEIEGRGQFRPNAGANPTLGQVGTLECVTEWRVEMLVDESRWPTVKQALIHSHPYESPAYDVVALFDSGAG